MIRFGRSIKVENFHELLSNRKVAKIEIRRVKNQHQDKSNLQVHVYAQVEKNHISRLEQFYRNILEKGEKLLSPDEKSVVKNELHLFKKYDFFQYNKMLEIENLYHKHGLKFNGLNTLEDYKNLVKKLKV